MGVSGRDVCVSESSIGVSWSVYRNKWERYLCKWGADWFR